MDPRGILASCHEAVVECNDVVVIFVGPSTDEITITIMLGALVALVVAAAVLVAVRHARKSSRG